MSNAIEIEAKALVSQRDYEKLLRRFAGEKAYEQTNYYIDNGEGLLRKEGFALRIREREGLYEMTLKTPLSEGLLEKNCAWSKDRFDAFMQKGVFPEGDIKRFLTMLDIDVSKLKVLTSLTTKRVDVEYEGGKLSLDENHYSGHVDYEIELEHNSMVDATEKLHSLFIEEKIPFVLNLKTKVARALNAVGQQKPLN
ncbi:MAG: CYTH domain-containing protein [Bacilli bacterium]|jgi:uncharacterized protein YjbK|nr:CYTH domain-containing protein [Bacilli bacterium]